MAGPEGEATLVNMWRARSRSQSASDKEAWMPQGYGSRPLKRMLGNVERHWKGSRKGSHIHKEPKHNHHVCRFMWTDKHWILERKKENAEQMTKELVEEVDNLGHGTKRPPACGGRGPMQRRTSRTSCPKRRAGNTHYLPRTSSGSWATCSVAMGECRFAWRKGCRAPTRRGGVT